MIELYQLEDIASKCTCCDLHTGRDQPVFSRGNPRSEILVCGMCPGPDENKAGAPFVGTAGRILDQILIDAYGTTGNVYITNLVKCFVKPGTKLLESWMDNCLQYFIVQIKKVEPKVIVALGQDVCGFFLSSPLSIGKLRTQNYEYLNIPLICTYHPSYLARGGGKKHTDYSKVVEDFRKALKYL
jgi:DNA polymerase